MKSPDDMISLPMSSLHSSSHVSLLHFPSTRQGKGRVERQDPFITHFPLPSSAHLCILEQRRNGEVGLKGSLASQQKTHDTLGSYSTVEIHKTIVEYERFARPHRRNTLLLTPCYGRNNALFVGCFLFESPSTKIQNSALLVRWFSREKPTNKKCMKRTELTFCLVGNCQGVPFKKQWPIAFFKGHPLHQEEPKRGQPALGLLPPPPEAPRGPPAGARLRSPPWGPNLFPWPRSLGSDSEKSIAGLRNSGVLLVSLVVQQNRRPN